MLDEILTRAVDEGAVPNIVAIVETDDGIAYTGAAGPVTPASVFRLASMTKIVTTIAALDLEDLDLDARVSHYVPAFAELEVLTGFQNDEPRYRAPKTQATVRQLITHTSGLGYWFYSPDLARWERLTGTPNVTTDSRRIFEAPLVADPGTGFNYGIGIDWLGRVVEAVSGRPLDQHLEQTVFAPLGMRHTTFAPQPDAVPIHVRKDGRWRPLPNRTAAPGYPAGGHGLYSTPADFARFQRTLLDRPALFEPQLAFPETIASADPRFARDFAAGPGHSWGLGLLLDPGGSGSWWGLFNSHFWVDPTTRTTGAVYTQALPFMDEAIKAVVLDIKRAFYA